MRTRCASWFGRAVALAAALGTIVFAPAAVAPRGDAQPPGIIPGTPGRSLAPVPSASRTLRLAILPDRTVGRAWGFAYLATAVEDLNRIGPDAVISIGDMVEGYTRSVERWDREVEQFQSYLARLEAPFYPLAGNHEVVSGTRREDDRTFEDRYRTAFGPLYYTIEFDLATLIICHSEDERFRGGVGLGNAQLAWMRDQLVRARRRGEPTFVLMHRPLWREWRDEWFARVHPLLVESNVRAVLAGHLHSMQRDPDVDGVQYHILGVCGGMIDQHPLTGQFHHLTFLSIRPGGDWDVFHLPVGTTLPEDFILSADQNRVFVLKTNRAFGRMRGAVDDPFDGPVDDSITVELRNPIDVPITVETTLLDARPGPEFWPGSPWIGRTPSDILNPYVSDVDTSFRLASAPGPVSLAPGETRAIELRVTSPRLEAPGLPPEIRFRLSFVDGHGRTVPVETRRRIPLQRSIAVGSGAAEVAWPICAWSTSVYERLEPNPQATITMTDGALRVTVAVPEDVLSGYPDDPRPAHERARDPTSDAVVVRLDGDVTYFAEPFVDRKVWRIDDDVAVLATDVKVSLETAPGDDAAAWTVSLEIPLAGDTAAAVPSQIDIGVADNDETYHTQWRWLAPRGRPARITRR